MSNDDDWRRQLADARYGDTLTPGFARKTNLDLVGPRHGATPKLVFSPSVGADDHTANPMRSMPLPLSAVPESGSAQLKRPGAKWVWWFGTGLLVIAAAATFGWETKPPQHQPKAQIVASINRQPPAMVAQSTFRIFPRASGNSSPAIVAHIEPVTNEPGSDHLRAMKNAPRTIASVGQIEPSSDPLSSTVSLPPPRSDRSKPSQAPSAFMEAQKSPSFQCHAGQGEITRSICTDPTLAALDRTLAARFAALDDSVDPATVEALHHGETTFLNARQLCLDKACLADVYRERLRDLDAIKP
ncbi:MULTISPECIES: lysozyme inhibitor LprI family protein [Sphingosinicellaceae]|uniref:lysozyme inhibitor LprI family protein n=1 Tax=Sphingosinicellaceae TaxID=2820280 RepID=UPI001C1E2609|nr:MULTISPECIES: hypothetical protein [Polymorphobacter]QYE32983.1 hypothetical protein KZX46_02205 [Polymorphobacter sp. PAMC 29334]UAJ12243.1 hypothetical protein KTC28_20625 [Polymorphobacter megasporae]